MRAWIAIALLAAGLAGCQTTEESFESADYTCREAGLRPGSAAFNRCRAAAFRENRRQSEQAANTAAAGVAAGVIGGAIVGAAASRPYYHGYYYRCNAWGCW